MFGGVVGTVEANGLLLHIKEVEQMQIVLNAKIEFFDYSLFRSIINKRFNNLSVRKKQSIILLLMLCFSLFGYN